jgi:hypothetical protein
VFLSFSHPHSFTQHYDYFSHPYNYFYLQSAQTFPWKKAIYEGPATVQISVIDAALVLQIAQDSYGAHLETIPFLSDVLGDSSILKVGVGLDQDMIELIRWPEQTKKNEGRTIDLWEDEIVGRLDIGGIGAKYGRTMSLKSLAMTVCGVDLPKDKRLSRSNWAQSPRLSSKQIAYAARDAWVSAAVLAELSQRDPEQFSTEALLKRVGTLEKSIHELDEKAKARREAKIKLLAIIGKKDERINRKDLTSEQLENVVELEQIIKDLAPPHPILFDVEDLGLL